MMDAVRWFDAYHHLASSAITTVCTTVNLQLYLGTTVHEATAEATNTEAFTTTITTTVSGDYHATGTGRCFHESRFKSESGSECESKFESKSKFEYQFEHCELSSDTDHEQLRW